MGVTVMVLSPRKILTPMQNIVNFENLAITEQAKEKVIQLGQNLIGTIFYSQRLHSY